MGRWIATAGILAALLPACRRERAQGPDRPRSPIAAPDPALSPVNLPPWERLEDAARQVLLPRERQLAARAADRAARTLDLAAAYGDLGRAYHAFGLHDSAAPCYANALRLDPGTFAWPYLLARAQWPLGEADAARASLERALALQPDSLPALGFLADIHRAAGRMDEAREVYRRALAVEGGSAAAHYGLGQLAFLTGDFAAAVTHFEQALAAQPEGAGRVHYQLALAYRQVGNLEKWRLHLARRGEGAPGTGPDPAMEDVARLNPRTFARRGVAALRAGNPGRAVELLQEAARAAPEDVDLRLQLGVALASAARPEEALTHLRAALRLKPTDPRLHYHLGIALSATGRDQEAVAALRRAVELHPGYAEAQLGLAQGLRRLGRHAEALEPLEEAVRINPSSVAARVQRGQLLARLGRCREAVDAAESGLRAFPADRALAVLLARLLSACPDPAVRDADRALTLAKQAFAAGGTVEHAATVALAHAARGDWNAAEAWQRRAIAMLPEGRAPAARAVLGARLGEYRGKRLPAVEW